MKTFKKAALGVAALALSTAVTPITAAPTLEYQPDNYPLVTLDPFGAFDWNSAGSAVTEGFVPDGSTVFTTEFWADAVNIQDPGGINFSGTFLEASGLTPPTGAEFTIQAFINETATLSGPTATFFATGGSWTIWYEGEADADLIAGTGITDGIEVMSGSILPGFAGTFTALPVGGGTGVFNFLATVDSTNNAFINPNLLDSEAVSTIQFGTSTTGWTFPTGRPSGGPLAGEGILVFQADANQSFQPEIIPEPGVLALLSLGLLGVAGFKHRRRHQG